MFALYFNYFQSKFSFWNFVIYLLYNLRDKVITISFGRNVVLNEDDNLCQSNPNELKNNYNNNNINNNNNNIYNNIYED